MKPTEIWLKFYVGNYVTGTGKPLEQTHFVECALYKPTEISSREIEKLRRKLHDDLDRMIEHAKTSPRWIY